MSTQTYLVWRQRPPLPAGLAPDGTESFKLVLTRAGEIRAASPAEAIFLAKHRHNSPVPAPIVEEKQAWEARLAAAKIISNAKNPVLHRRLA